jgi:hypothetical protein
MLSDGRANAFALITSDQLSRDDAFKIMRVGQLFSQSGLFRVRSFGLPIFMTESGSSYRSFKSIPMGSGFWPDDEEVDMIMALLPNRDTQRQNNSTPQLPSRLSMTKT